MTDSLPALLARLETNGRTWDQMRRDSKEAAAVIRGLMQQNAELATHAKGLIDALNELTERVSQRPANDGADANPA